MDELGYGGMRAEIECIAGIIREQYQDSLTLTELSRQVGLSRFHMARLFSQETGLPPGLFLTAVRLEQARWKLLHSEDNIADVSLQVGYSSIGTFTTRFTQVTGVSPGKYRRLASLGIDVDAFGGTAPDAPVGYGTVVGTVQRTDGLSDEPLFAAAFPAHRGVPRFGARPARCRRVPRSDGLWRLRYVPTGSWSVQVVSRTRDGGVLVAESPTFEVAPGSVNPLELTLRPALQLPRPSRIDFPAEAAAQLPDLYPSDALASPSSGR
ncbi:AraC family transcriptional regulator [Streptomyces sp. NPDC048306]|uniref:AraC family transcriptional regulator n=1 Tax=Streptomyces sp. NPDC048306 TaxID=3154502 RepID=UPI0033D7F486